MKHRFTMVMMALLVIASFTLVNAENYIHPVKAQKYETSLMDYKTTPEAYLDWTEGFANYYLSSGAAADTFAVYFKPTGTGIILNSIEMKWYDGDGATNVLVYAWEIGPDCPPSGLASDIDDTLHVHVLGDVLAGPIPFAPVAGYDWQGFELSDFSGDIPIGGDGDPVPFFLGFVKLGALPQPLAADVTNYLSEEINHTFIKGPNFSTANEWWQDYNSYIELCMRAGVTFVGDPSPVISGPNQLPNTYDGTQDFAVSADVTDNLAIPEGNVELLYNVNGGENTTVVMTADGDTYSYTLTGLGLVAGDVVQYWVKAVDSGENETIGNAREFTVIAAANADANILLVDDGMAIDALAPLQAYLEELGQSVEAFVIADNNGWDASITSYTGNSGTIYDAIIIMGFGTITVPARAYDGNPVAAYLDAGGNLLYADQDYFYTNGEVAAPEFAPDDFAYDYFSILSGDNDPAEDAVIEGYGADFLADITSAALDYSIFGNTNWPDFLTEEDAVPILLSIDGTGTYADMTMGTFYAGDGFNTILFVAPILAMNEGTAEEVILSASFKDLIELCLVQGFGIVTGIDTPENMTNSFKLAQNYPNPFNPVTSIEFTITKASKVSLIIYNAMGQKVRTLVDGHKVADTYNATWDATNDAGNNVSSGIYYYRLKAGDISQVRKMVLLK